MTKDGERIAILETKVETLEKEHESWNSLVKKVVIQSFMWLVAVIISGITFGWHLPENIRKAIADWASK